ncbi:MAG: ATP F0F1 synthase subunit B [Pseudomonadota bacterium]
MSVLTTALLAAEEAASGGLPQLDTSTYASQIFWLIVTFGVLYWFMSSIALPSIGGVIEERSDRIAADLDAAAELNAEAEAAERGYEQALADAKAKASAIAAETRKGIDEDIAKMQAETEERLAAKIDEAEKRIAKAQENVGEAVRAAATDVAGALVAALIEETPSDDAVKRAVNAADA